MPIFRRHSLWTAPYRDVYKLRRIKMLGRRTRVARTIEAYYLTSDYARVLFYYCFYCVVSTLSVICKISDTLDFQIG